MKISIKYHDINIRMTNPGSKQGSGRFKICTQEELSKCLYRILDLRIPNSKYTFYLYNLYIEDSKNSKKLCSYNDAIQRQFNEVIQLFIDVKEQDHIRADKVNNIILNVKFNDSKNRSSTKLVEKLIRVYNTVKSIKISVDTVIALSEIQESLADKDRYFCNWNKQIIYHSTKKEMKPNIVFNHENANSSCKASQRNDELTEEDLKITQHIKVEDGVMEDIVDHMCLISNWYNDNNYSVM